LAEARDPGFALYVHWPFCLSKCPYCDFNSHVRARIDAEAYVDAVLRELDTVTSRLDHVKPLDSIFFGGGTPSLMPGHIVQAIIDRARDRFGLQQGAEITLEANPTSADAGRFRAYRDAGVNRVSLGVQALNDADLKALGRLHSVSEALAAVELAQSIFSRVSFDLIYARPGQTLEAWQAELEQALGYGCRHYSLYQLTFEEGTPFHAALQRGLMHELDVETASAMFEFTQARMEEAGRPAYEVSNYAVPGEQSRHNLVYWRYGDYVGVGPGAHGRIRSGGARIATQTERQPELWLRRVAEQGNGLTGWETVDPVQQATEALLMGLRLNEGIDLSRIEAMSPMRLSAPKLAALVGLGFLQQDGKTLKTTPKGRLVLNAVLKELLA
jgi:oxygen-independent coproporphyrinogen-3 oxidase